MNPSNSYLMKLMRLAENLGMDKNELMQMPVIEAVAKIEETKLMWKRLREEVR